MTDDSSSLIVGPYAGTGTGTYSDDGNSTAATLASVITNPRWSQRLAAATDDDELVKAAWAVFLAAVTKCHHGPETRSAARRQIATALVDTAARLTQ